MKDKNIKSEKKETKEIKDSSNVVKSGEVVTVEYEGKFEDGEIFDSSNHGDHSHPLTFTVGNKEVVDGFDSAVIGMKEGEEKEITLKPEQAYGMPSKEYIKSVPKRMFSGNPEKGMQVAFQSPHGPIPGTIIEIVGDMIKVDMNHPLAGKTLIFKIKVIGIGADKVQEHHPH